MSVDAASTDAGIGYAVLLSLVALAGVLLMYVGAGDPLAGWGFALAMVAASAAVAVPHLVGSR